VDPTIIRLILVFLALLTAVMPVLVTYVVAWIIVPERD
jgi:phage shock protein PspC (stress-responsive transcriptional regulator)